MWRTFLSLQKSKYFWPIWGMIHTKLALKIICITICIHVSVQAFNLNIFNQFNLLWFYSTCATLLESKIKHVSICWIRWYKLIIKLFINAFQERALHSAKSPWWIPIASERRRWLPKRRPTLSSYIGICTTVRCIRWSLGNIRKRWTSLNHCLWLVNGCRSFASNWPRPSVERFFRLTASWPNKGNRPLMYILLWGQ